MFNSQQNNCIIQIDKRISNGQRVLNYSNENRIIYIGNNQETVQVGARLRLKKRKSTSKLQKILQKEIFFRKKSRSYRAEKLTRGPFEPKKLFLSKNMEKSKEELFSKIEYQNTN